MTGTKRSDALSAEFAEPEAMRCRKKRCDALSVGNCLEGPWSTMRVKPIDPKSALIGLEGRGHLHKHLEDKCRRRLRP